MLRQHYSGLKIEEEGVNIKIHREIRQRTVGKVHVCCKRLYFISSLTDLMLDSKTSGWPVRTGGEKRHLFVRKLHIGVDLRGDHL